MDNPQYLILSYTNGLDEVLGFKPYYKWITLNTLKLMRGGYSGTMRVLNLIING